MTDGWSAGTEPWLRRVVRMDGKPRCPFCGQRSLIRAFGDINGDGARVEVYCDSRDCEARTITVLVTRDGTNETADRPDVRALEAIDSGRYVQPSEIVARTLNEIINDDVTSHEAVLGRRTLGTPVIDLRDPSEGRDDDGGAWP